MMMLENEYIVAWIPVGKPMRMMFCSSSQSQRSLRSSSRNGPDSRASSHHTPAAQNPCERIVA